MVLQTQKINKYHASNKRHEVEQLGEIGIFIAQIPRNQNRAYKVYSTDVDTSDWSVKSYKITEVFDSEFIYIPSLQDCKTIEKEAVMTVSKETFLKELVNDWENVTYYSNTEL